VRENLAIQAVGLRKVYGEGSGAKVAVADLHLEVQRGEVFGFLGPNGSGKTTAIKMLLGLTHPTSGEANLLGLKPHLALSRKKVGFLPEHFRFHDWLTAGEFLALHGRLYGMPQDVSRQRIPELLELVGLAAHANKMLRTFSKGMLQRIGLAQALLNQPEVVFLDEPTSGLDPVGRRLVRDIIRQLRQAGTTVFLNSHLLSEVEITCDRVAFIKNGVVLQTSPLKQLFDGELSAQVRGRGFTPAILEELKNWGDNIRLEGETVYLSLRREDDLPLLNRYLVYAGVEVYTVQLQKSSLEELFIQIVGTDGGL
jgi:ABC-2 type transport system ATP-binding protein